MEKTAYTVLTRELFEASLAEGFEVQETDYNELIYTIQTSNPDIDARIQSTIHKNFCASKSNWKHLKIVYWDNVNDRLLDYDKRSIPRTGNMDHILSQVRKQIQSYLQKAGEIEMVSWEYVKAVLEHPVNHNGQFAQSLLKYLKEKSYLTQKQLMYVLGPELSNGHKTMESRIVEDEPSFSLEFVDRALGKEQKAECPGPTCLCNDLRPFELPADGQPVNIRFLGPANMALGEIDFAETEARILAHIQQETPEFVADRVFSLNHIETTTGRITSETPNMQEIVDRQPATMNFHEVTEYNESGSVYISGKASAVTDFMQALTDFNEAMQQTERRINLNEMDRHIQTLMRTIQEINTHGKILCFNNINRTYELILPDSG